MDAPTAAARRVVEREFPGAELLATRPAPGGQKTTVFATLADREAVVHLCDRSYEPRFVLETALLALVADRTAVPVPTVLAADYSKRALPSMYAVTERVPGEPLSDLYGTLPDESMGAVLETAGRLLGAVHVGVPFEASGPLRPGADGDVVLAARRRWPAFLESLMERWSANLAGGRFADLAPAFESVAATCRERLADLRVGPTLLHFDYRPENVVVRDGEVVAILDWGRAVAGHREYDFFKFEKNFLLAHVDSRGRRNQLRRHVYRGYRASAGLDDGWRARRALYRVAFKLESFQSFHRWTRGLDDGERERMASRLRAELEEDLARL